MLQQNLLNITFFSPKISFTAMLTKREARVSWLENHKPLLILALFILSTKSFVLWLCFHGGWDGKESACKAGDLCLIHELGRSSGEGNSYSLWYSCLENPHGQRSLWATVHGIAESDMTEWLTLSLFTFTEVFFCDYINECTCIHYF